MKFKGSLSGRKYRREELCMIMVWYIMDKACWNMLENLAHGILHRIRENNLSF